MSIGNTEVDFKEIYDAINGEGAHTTQEIGMDSFYDQSFTNGTSTPESGAISIGDIKGKTIETSLYDWSKLDGIWVTANDGTNCGRALEIGWYGGASVHTNILGITTGSSANGYAEQIQNIKDWLEEQNVIKGYTYYIGFSFNTSYPTQPQVCKRTNGPDGEISAVSGLSTQSNNGWSLYYISNVFEVPGGIGNPLRGKDVTDILRETITISNVDDILNNADYFKYIDTMIDIFNTGSFYVADSTSTSATISNGSGEETIKNSGFNFKSTQYSTWTPRHFILDPFNIKLKHGTHTWASSPGSGIIDSTSNTNFKTTNVNGSGTIYGLWFEFILNDGVKIQLKTLTFTQRSGYATLRPDKFYLLGSDNGTDWTNYLGTTTTSSVLGSSGWTSYTGPNVTYTGVGTTGLLTTGETGLQKKIIAISNSSKYRYWRIILHGRTGNYAAIRQIKFTGDVTMSDL